MAGANTLRPIVLPEPVSQPFWSRGKFGMLGTAAWLCLVGMGSSQPLLHASSPVPATGTSPTCRIQQRTPLYVGFANGVSLDSFEESAVASRNIVREIRHWACDASTSTSVAVPSLQLAFARSTPVRLERVQFDDPALAHAHVVLSSTVAEHDKLHWRVDVTQGAEAGWAVTRTGIAGAEDLAEPQ
jgi:hypothetical protein